MSQAFRCLAVLMALTTVSAAFRQEDRPGQDTSATDAAIYHALRDVINRGADVYNNEDYSGCYRIFEGGLVAFKGQLAHRPDLQKLIAAALTSAEADPLVWRRAFTLRAALDKLRKELNPKKDNGGKAPPADKDKQEKDRQDKDKNQPMPDKDKAEKDKQDKDKQDKDKGEKDKGDTKPPPPPDKDKDSKDDQQKDKKKSDDLNAERLPPPFREEKKDA